MENKTSVLPAHIVLEEDDEGFGARDTVSASPPRNPAAHRVRCQEWHNHDMSRLYKRKLSKSEMALEESHKLVQVLQEKLSEDENKIEFRLQRMMNTHSDLQREEKKQLLDECAMWKHKYDKEAFLRNEEKKIHETFSNQWTTEMTNLKKDIDEIERRVVAEARRLTSGEA